MLQIGTRAPEITDFATHGKRFVLSEQTGLANLAYFFPRAFTFHCTREACVFRDNTNELLLAGATVVGISTDDDETLRRFASSLSVPFPLIADTEKRIARAYGVLWPIVGLARRVTFIVGGDMRIEAVFHHEFDVKQHRDDVLRFVHAKFESRNRKD